jgi:hypothetical protein
MEEDYEGCVAQPGFVARPSYVKVSENEPSHEQLY